MSNTFKSPVEMIADTRTAMDMVTTGVQFGLHDVEEPARLMVDAFFAGEHMLLQGVPGVGKTAMAENLAATVTDGLWGHYARIQGTYDTMPADLRGAVILNPLTRELETELGPIFSNLLVFDEANRFPPKTQSALNEAMNDHKVTIGKQRFNLPDPFFVVGTENPHAIGEGTNPMPGALIDRFGASMYMESPRINQRLAVVEMVSVPGRQMAKPSKVIDVSEIPTLKNVIRTIGVEEGAKLLVAKSLSDLPKATGVEMKADGYRSVVSAINLARARAVRIGSGVVSVDVVREVLPYVMRHRFDLRSRDSEFEKQAVIARALGL